MDITARTPGTPGTAHRDNGTGTHIRQLLSLARALTAAATEPCTDTGTATEGADTTGTGTGTGTTEGAEPTVADTAEGAESCTDPCTGSVSFTAFGAVSGGEGRVRVPLGVELGSLTDQEAVEWAQSVEQLNRFVQALAVQAAGDLAHRVRQGRFLEAGVGAPAGLLVQALLLGKAEASRRLHLAARFLPVADPLTTMVAGVRQPVLGSAFFSGDLSPEQALLASRCLDEAAALSAAGRIPEQQRQDMEQTLTGYARQEAPDFLRRVGTRIMNHLDPDGQQPTAGALLAKQGLFFHQPRRGLIHFEGHMTLPQYEHVMVTIGWATNPTHHTTNPGNPDPGTNTGTGTGTGDAAHSPATGDAARSPAPATARNPGSGDTAGGTTGTSAGVNAGGRAGGSTGSEPGQGSLFNPLTALAGIAALFTGTPAPATTGAGTGEDRIAAGNSLTPPPDRATPAPGPAPLPSAGAVHGPGPGPGAGRETGRGTGPRGEASPTPAAPGPGPGGTMTAPKPMTAPPPMAPPAPAPLPRPEGAPVPEPALWLNPATEPAGIGWQSTQEPTAATAPIAATGEDLSWLWHEPPPAPIGWDPPPATTTNPHPAPPDTTTGDATPDPATPTTTDTTGTAIKDTGCPDPETAGTDNPDLTTTDTDRPAPVPTSTDTTDSDPARAENPWPSHAARTRIPAPGSGAVLESLDPIDPNSTDPAVKDRRTHAQRLLDGLITALALAARTGKLPTNGGLKTQLIITTTDSDLDRHHKTRNGTAHTPFSGPVPLTPFEETCCDADRTYHHLGQGQTILNIGRTQRLFTPAQRKILIARDLGCTFPDCTAPAYWCQAHHITPWHHGGETSINNAALLCSHHHHLIHSTDWTITNHHGTPHFTAPHLIDPTRKQRRNTYHHGHPKNH